MVNDIGGGLQRYIDEGNQVTDGVNSTDVYWLARTFDTTGLPTGRETTLQDAARNLARQKQVEDPNFRLTPGDLFYLSLALNKGNIRNALVTCHATLYRPNKSGGANKDFIEKENVLAPIRNPDGYADQEWTYSTPLGTKRTINPRRDISSDQQGVWYHLFGLAALEFTDNYGAASYYAAQIAIFKGGALPEDKINKIREKGFPVTGLGGRLGDLAVAIEENTRSNQGKPPDLDKFCINYTALATGRRLKEIYYGKVSKDLTKKWQERYDPYSNTVTLPNGVILFKSPLSLRVEGSQGEWFTFDYDTQQLDGNTPLFFFDLAQEEDGSWDFIGIPYFEVSNVKMIGAGEAPVTLALYDRASSDSAVYQFTVKQGDKISLSGLKDTPVLNGNSLEAIAKEHIETSSQPETSISTPVPGSSDTLLCLGAGITGVICLAVVGLAGGFFIFRKRSHPIRSAGSTEPVEQVTQVELSDEVITLEQAVVASAHLVGMGEHATLLVELSNSPVTIGRSTTNTLVLAEPDISSKHAQLFIKNNAWAVRDLKSRNGTFVNGNRIQELVLQEGDLLQIGSYLMVYRQT